MQLKEKVQELRKDNQWIVDESWWESEHLQTLIFDKEQSITSLTL